MDEKLQFDVLALNNIIPSEISLDYIRNKTQFQLHDLPTEQRHSKTWDLSETAETDTKKALDELFSVDEDITRMFKALIKDESTMSELESLIREMEDALKNGRKIYIYGCGAGGRIAKQIESAFWRPFCAGLPEKYRRLKDCLIGELTGGDRALISSLEGLEDLHVVGECQLKDRRIAKGDIVIGISANGGTSAVLGAVSAARNMYEDENEAKRKLYLLLNNPQSTIARFERSESVMKDAGITKVSLCTGPQAVTGSTRMQAGTSVGFLVPILTEIALQRFLEDEKVPRQVLSAFGFRSNLNLKQCLSDDFDEIQKSTCATSSELALLTEMEANCYASKGRSTYWADSAIIAVFTDSSERSPTFRLFPLDPIDAAERKSWIRVSGPMKTRGEAWTHFLHRAFRGMQGRLFEDAFDRRIEDKYLKRAALRSLAKAGNDQELLYDFSLSNNVNVDENEAMIMTLMPGERFNDQHERVLSPFKHRGLILMGDDGVFPRDSIVVRLNSPVFARDPLRIRQNVALKMLLNAHSTCVMAKLGRLVGNTMTNVSPSNLKLVGRATYLIMTHVNDKLRRGGHFCSYEQINALLYDFIAYSARATIKGKVSEVAVVIVFILEAFKSRKAVEWKDAVLTLEKYHSLSAYLRSCDI